MPLFFNQCRPSMSNCVCELLYCSRGDTVCARVTTEAYGIPKPLTGTVHIECGEDVASQRGGEARDAASSGVGRIRNGHAHGLNDPRARLHGDEGTSKTVYHSVPPAGKTKQKHHEPEQPSNLNDHIRFALRDSERPQHDNIHTRPPPHFPQTLTLWWMPPPRSHGGMDCSFSRSQAGARAAA